MFDKMSFSKIGSIIVKNLFGFFNRLISASKLVLYKSTDPSQQFSATFKAGYSRQVQTCSIPYIGNTRKLQHETDLR